jgi:hypothetical protein
MKTFTVINLSTINIDRRIVANELAASNLIVHGKIALHGITALGRQKWAVSLANSS